MAEFRVVYTRTVVNELFYEAESIEDARSQWEADGYDGELFFIENEAGEQVIYD